MKMKKICNRIATNLKENIDSVYELTTFDEFILEFSISKIKKLNDKLKKTIDNPYLLADSLITQLEGIKENKSLRPKYETIFNQCVVLLISYFGSSLRSLFVECLNIKLKNGYKLSDVEDLKIPLTDLEVYNYDIENNIGEIVIKTKNISFQDMKSISRALDDWFGIKMERNREINNIILGQAARHIIVHSGSKIDQKFINQVKHAKPRELKLDLIENDIIKFNPDEIKILGTSILEFFNRVGERLSL